MDGRHIKIWPTAIFIKDRDSSLTLIQQNRKPKEQYCYLVVQEHNYIGLMQAKKGPFTSILSHETHTLYMQEEVSLFIINIFGRSPCSIFLFLVNLNLKEYLEFLFNLPFTTTFRKKRIDHDKAQYFQKQNK